MPNRWDDKPAKALRSVVSRFRQVKCSARQRKAGNSCTGRNGTSSWGLKIFSYRIREMPFTLKLCIINSWQSVLSQNICHEYKNKLLFIWYQNASPSAFSDPWSLFPIPYFQIPCRYTSNSENCPARWDLRTGDQQEPAQPKAIHIHPRWFAFRSVSIYLQNMSQ